MSLFAYSIIITDVKLKKRYEGMYDLGYKANKLGISAEANPYIGKPHADLWFRGWVEAESLKTTYGE